MLDHDYIASKVHPKQSFLALTLEREGDVRKYLWRAGDARYRYLYHRCISLGNVRSRALFKEIGLELLDSKALMALEPAALKIAQHYRKTKHEWSVISCTPQEKYLHNILKNALGFDQKRKRGISLFPEYVEGHKRAIGPFWPDFLIIGIRPIEGLANSLNGNHLVNRNWLAIVVEVDGPIHDDPRKARKDDLQEAFFSDLGIYTIKINNRDIDKYAGGIAPSALRQITELAKSNRLPRGSSLSKLDLKIDIRTISTFLTLKQMDEILREKFDHDFRLELGFRQIIAVNGRNLPRELNDDLKQRKEALNELDRAAMKAQLNRECLPPTLLDARSI